MNSTQKARTEAFRALHAPGNLLILPNAWDAASARAAEAAGASAIATSSAALAWAHGYPDGQAIPPSVFVVALAEITRVVKLPVSADSESGFSADPDSVARLVMSLIDNGVVGVNLEDGTAPPENLAAKITAIKKTAKANGADIFINARTDVYLRNLASDDAKLAETIRRGELYREAGADGLFVPALTGLAQIGDVARAVDLPLNMLIQKSLPPVAELKAAGVRRVSAGAGIGRAAYGTAMRATKMLLSEGKYDAIFEVSGECPEFNKLLARF